MQIRVKVIISVTNNGQVLLAEGYDPVRDLRFLIPVGGGVEFGEKLEDAAQRELKEEMGINSDNLIFLGFSDNRFTFTGVLAHELIFHYLCPISDQARADLPTHGTESDGEPFRVQWYSKDDLDCHKKSIVPPEAYEQIHSRL